MSDLFTQEVVVGIGQPETSPAVIHNAEVLGRQFQIYGTAENPLFLATDVAQWIEHSNVSVMLASVDDDEKEFHKQSLGNPGAGNPNKWFLTESGLYEVLMLSRKPIAKQFKKQVKQILHEIRTKGEYKVEKPKTPAQKVIEVIEYLQELNAQQQKQIEVQQQKLELAAPKVAFVDTLVTCTTGNMLVRDFAKQVAQSLGLRGFGQSVVFKWLKDHGYMNLNRYPSQKAKDMKLLELNLGMHQHHDGTSGEHHCSRITPKGQVYFYEKIKAQYEAQGRWW